MQVGRALTRSGIIWDGPVLGVGSYRQDFGQNLVDLKTLWFVLLLSGVCFMAASAAHEG